MDGFKVNILLWKAHRITFWSGHIFILYKLHILCRTFAEFQISIFIYKYKVSIKNFGKSTIRSFTWPVTWPVASFSRKAIWISPWLNPSAFLIPGQCEFVDVYNIFLSPSVLSLDGKPDSKSGKRRDVFHDLGEIRYAGVSKIDS